MTTKSVAELVAQARATVENLDAERFAAEVDGAVVVDLREAAELVETGHVPGAVHIPRGMIEFRSDTTSPYHDDRLDPGARTLLYCASGGRSALAAATLRELGYTNVAHLEGGFKAWTEAGLPVERVGREAAQR